MMRAVGVVGPRMWIAVVGGVGGEGMGWGVVEGGGWIAGVGGAGVVVRSQAVWEDSTAVPWPTTVMSAAIPVVAPTCRPT